MSKETTVGAALFMLAGCASIAQHRPTATADRSVIILVWDGLRPDAIDPADTPNLARLRETGADFTDNHSTYPTFTMTNSASFATGAFPEATGYYGNVLWQPGATGKDSAGKPVDFHQPVFSEDYAILDGLKDSTGELFLVDTLFAAAQRAGMPTLAVGKTGAAYLQDTRRGGMVIDEKTVLPLSLAKELQASGIALPATAPNAYAPGELVLTAGNGNPIDFKPPRRLKDGVSADPTDASGSSYKAGTAHLVNAYVDYVLPRKRPRLSLVWLRDPDTTQHVYGIGTSNWHDALRANDAFLGRILAKLEELGMKDATDLIVVSDHGHSNVSGPVSLFPLRAVRDGEVADIDAHGHSVSGLVRLADLLRRGGFTAFDGLGCTYLPVAMGIRRDGALVYPASNDPDGSVCGKEGQTYQLPPFKVPAQLPARALVVAVNGGSDYIYVPDHDPELVRTTVAFLQGRGEVGAVFVDDRYGGIPGTLPLSAIHAKDSSGRNPDIILGYDYDENAVIEGVRGTEMAGVLLGNSYRGMHGTFGPRDVHNTLIAVGPDFRPGFKDALPTGNVDVAPTVARILGVSLPRAQGRPLLEAMTGGGAAVGDYRVESRVLRPAAPATGLTIRLPTDPGGNDLDPRKGTYTFELHTKSLTHGGIVYTYFDFAKAVRQ
jgi:arylsulfatase A-like enzyme